MLWMTIGVAALLLAVLVTWAIRFVLVVRRYRGLQRWGRGDSTTGRRRQVPASPYDVPDNIGKTMTAYLLEALPFPNHPLPPPPPSGKK
jgi:hypothetical protein